MVKTLDETRHSGGKKIRISGMGKTLTLLKPAHRNSKGFNTTSEGIHMLSVLDFNVIYKLVLRKRFQDRPLLILFLQCR